MVFDIALAGCHAEDAPVVIVEILQSSAEYSPIGKALDGAITLALPPQLVFSLLDARLHRRLAGLRADAIKDAAPRVMQVYIRSANSLRTLQNVARGRWERCGMAGPLEAEGQHRIVGAGRTCWSCWDPRRMHGARQPREANRAGCLPGVETVRL